jgi:hypothetical protein
VSGTFEVQALASDAHGIEALWFAENLQFVGQPEIVTAGPAPRLTGYLDSTAFADGQLLIQVGGRDTYDNVSTGVVTVIVNNDAPLISISVSVPAPGGAGGDWTCVASVPERPECASGERAAVSGVVLLEATAVDAEGVSAFELRSPAGLTDTAQELNVIRAEWDTTAGADGPTPVELFAADLTGNGANQTLSIDVDNLSDGTMSGQVALDTPVKNLRVQVLAFAGAGRGQLLGETTSATGSFSVTVSDAYAGPSWSGRLDPRLPTPTWRPAAP